MYMDVQVPQEAWSRERPSANDISHGAAEKITVVTREACPGEGGEREPGHKPGSIDKCQYS
jgi:hypothetical protein